MSLKCKNELHRAALLIRFRTTEPTSKSRKFRTYKDVAKATNLTEYEVQHICRKALLPAKTPTAEQRVYQLERQHLDFLLSSRTLEQWAGFTVK